MNSSCHAQFVFRNITFNDIGQVPFFVHLRSGEDIRVPHLDAQLVPKDNICVRLRLADEPVKTLKHFIDRACLGGIKKRNAAARSHKRKRKQTPRSKRKRRKNQLSAKKVFSILSPAVHS